MTADIFISFASQDAKIANTISAAIESRGFKCWISSRDILPGENFQSAIVRAIRSSRILLLVFTSNSNRSDEMTKELALASQQKLMVVPLRVEDVTPSDAFAYEFATRQWIDLFADWELAMNQLCARLGAALANEPHTNDTIVLGRASAPQTDAPRPLQAAHAAATTPAARTASRPAAPGPRSAAPRSPLLKVALGAAALVAAAAIAVPALMKRPVAASAVPAAAAVPANAMPASAMPGSATPVSAAAPADVAPAAADPALVVAAAQVPAPATAPVAGGDAKDAKDAPKPVERRKRVPQQPQPKPSSNLPY